MLFLSVASAIFFGLDAIARLFHPSEKAKSFTAWGALAIVIAAFGVLFGFDGLFASDWSDRARR